MVAMIIFISLNQNWKNQDEASKEILNSFLHGDFYHACIRNVINLLS